MKPKTIGKIIVDSFMTVALLALMGRQLWGDVAHEWIGTGMFILFITHHVLNLNWYKSMFRGKYSPYRTLQLVVDILVFAAMIGLMVSGIMLSQHVFVFVPTGSDGISFARVLHMLASYWGFVLMALHFGLHWNMFIKMTRITRKLPKLPPAAGTLLRIIGVAVVLYGAVVFVNRDLFNYMFLRTQFVFLDYEESSIHFYLDYIPMMVFWVWIAHNIEKLLRKRPAGKK